MENLSRRQKDPNAVALGSKGGLARSRNLTAAEMSAIGQMGAAIRWGKCGLKARSSHTRVRGCAISMPALERDGTDVEPPQGHSRKV
jgi:hypothetical protein